MCPGEGPFTPGLATHHTFEHAAPACLACLLTPGTPGPPQSPRLHTGLGLLALCSLQEEAGSPTAVL